MTIIELNEHFMLIKEHQLNCGFSFLISFFLARVEVAGLTHMSQYVYVSFGGILEFFSGDIE